MSMITSQGVVSWQDAGDIPAIRPPPGLSSDFNTPLSLAHWGLATDLVCLSIVTLFFAIKIITRFGLVRKSSWEDYSAILAWLGLVVLVVIQRQADRFGNGKHLWDVKDTDYAEAGKFNYIFQILYYPAIFIAKLSVLQLYRQVFAPTGHTAVRLTYNIWSNFTFYLVVSIVQICQCMPLHKAWLSYIPGECIDQVALQLSTGLVNVVSDIEILMLPLLSIYHLPLYKKGKAGVALVFGFGLLACAAAIARLAITSNKTGAADPTWDLYPINLISIIELSCIILVTSLPALPAFLRYLTGHELRIIASSSPAVSPHPDIARHHPAHAPRSGSPWPFFQVAGPMPPWESSGLKGPMTGWEEVDDVERGEDTWRREEIPVVRGPTATRLEKSYQASFF